VHDQYPAEHVGHLGPDHIQALERFKQLAQSKGYYTPAGTSGSDEPSHDDETLLYAREHPSGTHNGRLTSATDAT